jgi:hypothetical protein
MASWTGAIRSLRSSRWSGRISAAGTAAAWSRARQPGASAADPVRLVSDDARSQPGRRRGRPGWGARAGSDERLLDDVLGLLEIANQGEGRPERHLLKAPRHDLERLQVASLSPPNHLFQIHEHLLHSLGATAGASPFGNCRDEAPTTRALGRRRTERMRRGATSAPATVLS